MPLGTGKQVRRATGSKMVKAKSTGQKSGSKPAVTMPAKPPITTPKGQPNAL